MKRILVPVVTVIWVFFAACATDTGVIDGFDPVAGQGAEGTGAPEEGALSKTGGTRTTTVIISAPEPPARHRRDYPRPASYEAAAPYRNDTLQVTHLPQYVESLRAGGDPLGYVRQAAAYITKDSKTTFDKVKKIHDLVASTIKYDTASSRRNNTPQDFASVVTSRLATSEGYANLVKRFCDVLNIECEVIHGYGRGMVSPFVNERPGDANHAWNIVFINNEGYFIDCSWDAGNLRGGGSPSYTTDYLFLRPEYFIYDHFPDNPRQQLLENPLSRADFLKLPFCRPKFFEAFSDDAGGLAKILRTAGKTKLELPFTDGFIPRVEVYDETNGEKLDHRAFIQKEDSHYEVYLSFPSAGNYRVSFLVQKQGAQTSEPCAEFGVIASAGSTVTYPLQHTAFGPDISIISPLEMPLQKNKKYDFRIRAEGKRIVVLMYNQSTIPLRKDQAGNFFIEAGIPSNATEITLGAAYNPRDRYEKLVTYAVN
jgi:hypothetical protein